MENCFTDVHAVEVRRILTMNKDEFMSTDNVKVSAILPVYNVAKYLDDAVSSLLKQTYTNIEIIIIDDGSTDGSVEIGRKLAEENERVQFVAQANAGAASARNNGMNLASGKYLYFMDPDDVMGVNYIHELVSSAEKNKSQLVIAGFTNVFDDGNKVIKTTVTSLENNYTQNEWRAAAVKYLNNTQLAVPWNKLYLKSFILEKDLKFPSVKWDDLHFNLDVIKDVENVSVVSNAEYFYLRERPGSETASVFDNRLFSTRKAQFKHALEVFKSWDVTLENSRDGLGYYFSSRVLQIVQEISVADSLSWQQKKEEASTVLNDPLTKWSFINSKGNSGILRVLQTPLKNRQVVLSLVMGKFIGIFTYLAGGFFQKLRVKVMKV